VHVSSPLFVSNITKTHLTMLNGNYYEDWNLVTSAVQWQQVKWCFKRLNERNRKGELEKIIIIISRSVKTRSISSLRYVRGEPRSLYFFLIPIHSGVESIFSCFFRVLLSHISGFLLHCLVFMLLVSLSLTPPSDPRSLFFSFRL
jgi:hypothetical protein